MPVSFARAHVPCERRRVIARPTRRAGAPVARTMNSAGNGQFIPPPSVIRPRQGSDIRRRQQTVAVYRDSSASRTTADLVCADPRRDIVSESTCETDATVPHERAKVSQVSPDLTPTSPRTSRTGRSCPAARGSPRGDTARRTTGLPLIAIPQFEPSNSADMRLLDIVSGSVSRCRPRSRGSCW